MVFNFQDGRGPLMREAIQHFLEFSRQAPDDVSTLGAVGQIPPSIEHFPENLHNVPFFLFGAMHAGDPAQGEEVLRPLRDYRPALVDHSGVMPYLSAQQLFDADYPNGMRYYWKSLNLHTLEGEALDLFIEHALRQPSPFSTADIWPIGGAVKRFGPDHAALHGRHAAYLINPEANWVEPGDDEANIRWARDFVAAMRPWSDGGRYLNFGGFYEEGDGMMRDAYGPQYARLAQVKARYDPHNLFRLNANIQPAASV
jgi:FAD/FMN-containing dehydrogenase